MVTIKKKAYAKKSSGAGKPEQEIMALVNSVSKFASARKKTVRTAALVLAGLFIVFAGYSLKNSLDERKAGALLAAAYDQYSRNGANSDYTQSLELFRDIQMKYPSTTSGSVAAYYHANSLMNMGKNDEALREYNSFIGKYKDPFLLGLVYTRMGYLYKGQGKQEDAVKAFERADSLSGPGIATFELARLYEAAGDRAASEKKYSVIAEKLAGTSWAMEAMGKIGKGGQISGTAPVQKKTGQERTK